MSQRKPLHSRTRLQFLFALVASISSACVAGDDEYDGRAYEVVDGFYDATIVLNDEEMNVTLELKDGHYLWGGDMQISPDRIQTITIPNNEENQAVVSLNANHLPNRNQLWPDGIVPYELNDNLTTIGRTQFLNAVKVWEEQTPLRFIPRQSQHKGYLNVTDGEGCSAILGYQGVAQNLTLSANADLNCGIHEIGHAVGLRHEHQREDRDDFIDIYRSNLNWSKNKFNTNFKIGGNSYGRYDVDSIMHYPSYFSKADAVDPSQPILLLKNGGAIERAQRLSKGDLYGIELLYGDLPDYSPPTHVQVSQVTGDSAVCSWTPSPLVSMGNYFQYGVDFSKVIKENNPRALELISSDLVDRNSSSYAIKNLDARSTYECKVKVRNQSLQGPYSSPVSFTTLLMKTPHITRVEKHTDTSFDMHWERVDSPYGGVNYEVFQDGRLITRTTGTMISQANMTYNQSYLYRVHAIDSRGNRSTAAERAIVARRIPLDELLNSLVNLGRKCEPLGPTDANGNESCRL